MGVVDAIEWACVLCVCHIQNDWVSRATSLHQILREACCSSAGTIWMIQKALEDDVMSSVQIKVWHKLFRRRSRICWDWFTFRRPVTSRMPWECWTCTGCNQQRLATDSERTRSWSGDSENYCVWDFDAESWHEMFHGKIHSVALATRAVGTSCCSC